MGGGIIRTFEEHLDSLHQFYAADLSDLPTADNILDRVSLPGPDITYDQCNELIKECLQALNRYFEKYGQDYLNIITLEKMDNFLDWVKTLTVELQITTLQAMLVTHHFPSETKQGRQPSNLVDLLKSVGHFLVY